MAATELGRRPGTRCSAAFWIELRSAKQLLGIAFTGSERPGEDPKACQRTDISYLELRNRFQCAL